MTRIAEITNEFIIKHTKVKRHSYVDEQTDLWIWRYQMAFLMKDLLKFRYNGKYWRMLPAIFVRCMKEDNELQHCYTGGITVSKAFAYSMSLRNTINRNGFTTGKASLCFIAKYGIHAMFNRNPLTFVWQMKRYNLMIYNLVTFGIINYHKCGYWDLNVLLSATHYFITAFKQVSKHFKQHSQQAQFNELLYYMEEEEDEFD